MLILIIQVDIVLCFYNFPFASQDQAVVERQEALLVLGPGKIEAVKRSQVLQGQIQTKIPGEVP